MLDGMRPARNWPDPRSFQITALGARATLRVQARPTHDSIGFPESVLDTKLQKRLGALEPRQWQILPLGPGDWLIISDSLTASSLRDRVADAAGGATFVIVDMTDAFKVLEVRGAVARDVLAKGCGLDFHPSVFAPGRSARTRFAGMPVLIACLGEPDSFELRVPRSYEWYLHEWLTDAAIEFHSGAAA